MVRIENINKQFNGKQVLHAISGSFYKGKINFIIGASGTGKSVLLKCLVGLLKPDSGHVFFENQDFYHCDKSIQVSIRKKLGMLFQGSALFDSKNIEQNVMFPLNMQTNMNKSEKLDRVNFCLKRVGLENINKKMPSELSGGMKKRVGIARAIVMNPEYLFCDEPNSGLDPQNAILIDKLIREITEDFNMTTLIVSHDMNSVMQIADNIIFIYQGKVSWRGDRSNILDIDSGPIFNFIFSNRLMLTLRESKH